MIDVTHTLDALEGQEEREMNVADKHMLKVARDTMKMTCTAARIMGGQDHRDAAKVIYRLTGKTAKIDPDCTCIARQSKYDRAHLTPEKGD